MKTRESGMPDEQLWDTFFHLEATLDSLGIQNVAGNIADLACGYGTFTIPVARRTSGLVYGIDIDREMVHITQEKVKHSGLKNIRVIQKDFVGEGTGLENSSCDHVLLFNILHAEEPLVILGEAKRVLVSGGQVSITHWISDVATPRGPSMDIRPKPEQIQKWLITTGFELKGTVISLTLSLRFKGNKNIENCKIIFNTVI